MEMLQWRGHNFNELTAFCGQWLHHHPHSLYAEANKIVESMKE
jgi:hypothetical protein